MSGFIVKLGCNVLSMGTRCDGMVNKLLTRGNEHSLAVHKLRIGHIIKDKVQWHIKAFQDCNKFRVVNNTLNTFNFIVR